MQAIIKQLMSWYEITRTNGRAPELPTYREVYTLLLEGEYADHLTEAEYFLSYLEDYRTQNGMGSDMLVRMAFQALVQRAVFALETHPLTPMGQWYTKLEHPKAVERPEDRNRWTPFPVWGKGEYRSDDYQLLLGTGLAVINYKLIDDEAHYRIELQVFPDRITKLTMYRNHDRSVEETFGRTELERALYRVVSKIHNF